MTTNFHEGRRDEPVPTEVHQSEWPECVSGIVIVAQLIGQDTAQANDIVARSWSPVLAFCRALLAGGVDPNSKLECAIGAKLTIKETHWVGPKVVPYEPLSRDRVGRHARQNDDAAPPPLSADSLADG